MIEIQLPVSEVKYALAGFNKIVSSRTTLPALGCIRVEPQLGGLNLQVTDLDSYAGCRIKTTAPSEFPPCLVSLATLAKIAKTAKDQISLVYEAPHRIRVRHFIGDHPVEQAMDSIPLEDWPLVPPFKAEAFQVEPAFKEAFRQALECASSDSTRLILNSACLDVTQADCHCLVGCDGRHLFTANTLHFQLGEWAVIPNRRFLNWSGFVEDGDWFLAVEPPNGGKDPKPPYVQIQSGRWTFLTRGIEGAYPNWRQIIPSPDRKFTTVKLTEEAIGLMLDALPRMPGGDEANQPVTLVVGPGRLILRSRSAKDAEWTEVPIPDVSVIGADQRVSLNRSFISKALRFGFAEFEVQDHLSPVLFVAPGKKMLAAPMCLNDEPASAQATSQPAVPSPQEATKPTEAARPATPSASVPDNPTEQKPAMETANKITALPAPERGNLKATNGNGNGNGETPTALKTVVESVERIKINLRDMISDVNDTLDLLKAAEKEKKATLKEFESVRATLRSLQKVEL